MAGSKASFVGGSSFDFWSLDALLEIEMCAHSLIIGVAFLDGRLGFADNDCSGRERRQ